MTFAPPTEPFRLQACNAFFAGWSQRLLRPAPRMNAGTAPATSDAQILVVDGQSSVRQQIRDLLVQAGFNRMSEACDAGQALRMLNVRPMDVVLCAYEMPDGDGLELLRAIRGQEPPSHTGFILLTGDADRALVGRAVRCGVNHFLVKPFTAERLKRKIEDVMGAAA